MFTSSPELEFKHLLIHQFLNALTPNLQKLLDPQAIVFVNPVLAINTTPPSADRLLRCIYQVCRRAQEVFNAQELVLYRDTADPLQIQIQPLLKAIQHRYIQPKEKSDPSEFLEQSDVQHIMQCERSPYAAAIWRWKDGKILYANSRVRQFRVEPDEVVGSYILDYMHLKDWETMRRAVERDRKLKEFEFAAQTTALYWTSASFELVEYNNIEAIVAIYRPLNLLTAQAE